MDAAAMKKRIRICKTVCHLHGISDMGITKVRVGGTGWQTELAEQFLRRYLQKVGSANDVHGSDDGIKGGRGDSSKLANSEIFFA